MPKKAIKEEDEEEMATTTKTKTDNEPGSWECTVCTYRNRYEAFKCEICDTRKGTSTRKPRLNSTVVQQQTMAQTIALQQQHGEKALKKRCNSESRSRYSPESSFSITYSSKSTSQQQQKSYNCVKLTENIIKRKVIPFRDSLVVRSAAKKRQIALNGISFTLTEYKPRISPRGRKKLSTST